MTKEDKFLFVYAGRLCFALTLLLCIYFRHTVALESCYAWFTAHKMEILSCALTIDTTMLGFALTAVTILLSCMPRRLRICLKSDEKSATAKSIYIIFKLLLEDLVCFGVVLFVGVFSIQPTILQYVLFFIIAFSVLLFLRLYAVIWLTLSIVNIALIEKKADKSVYQ